MNASAKFELEDGFWSQPWYKIAGAILILAGLCYLAIAAVLGAFYGMFVGIDLATYWVFGLNWWESLVEVSLLGMCAIIATSIAYYIPVFYGAVVNGDRISGPVHKKSAGFAKGVFIWVIATHLLMSIFLAPMKREMAAIDAANPNPNPSYTATAGTRYTTEYDFGGKLTALVAKRDERLKRYGYVRVWKGWDVNPLRGGKSSVYVFIPGAALVWDWWFGYDQAIE